MPHRHLERWDVDTVEALHLAGDLAGCELHIDCGSSVLHDACHTK